MASSSVLHPFHSHASMRGLPTSLPGAVAWACLVIVLPALMPAPPVGRCGNLTQAQQLVRQALQVDCFHGPALTEQSMLESIQKEGRRKRPKAAQHKKQRGQVRRKGGLTKQGGADREVHRAAQAKAQLGDTQSSPEEAEKAARQRTVHPGVRRRQAC